MIKPLKDYPGYMASDKGYLINTKTGKKVFGGRKKKTGYIEVTMIDAEGRRKSKLLHRIIAESFCEKRDEAKEVNHKNGNKEDNRAENLEWVTRNENLQHAFDSGLMQNNTTRRGVIGIDKYTRKRTFYPSIYEAAKTTGISKGNICMCCKGQRPYAGEYVWIYAETA